MKGSSRGAALFVAAALAVGCGGSSPPSPSPGVPGPGQKQLTIVVAVVDSLMPGEITGATPNLLALKDGGTFYAESRSVFSAETIHAIIAPISSSSRKRPRGILPSM